jgi:hypothetical protein
MIIRGEQLFFKKKAKTNRGRYYNLVLQEGNQHHALKVLGHQNKNLLDEFRPL